MVITNEWQIRDNFNIRLASIIPPNNNKTYSVNLLKLYEAEPNYVSFSGAPWGQSGGASVAGDDGEVSQVDQGDEGGGTGSGASSCSVGPAVPAAPLRKVDMDAALRKLAQLKATTT